MDTYQFEYTPSPKWGSDKIIIVKFAYDPEYNERFTPEVVEEFIVQILNKYAQKAPVVEGFTGREILRFVVARIMEFSRENEGMWKTTISKYMTSKGKTDYLGNEIKSVFKQLRRYTPSTGSAGLRSRTAGASASASSASPSDPSPSAPSTGSPRQTTGPQLTPEGVESIRHSMLASSRRTRVRHVGRDTSRMKFKPIGGRK